MVIVIENQIINKKGTIIGYEQSPLVLRLKQCVESLMKEKDLIVEGNKYLDVKKNGIGHMEKE